MHAITERLGKCCFPTDDNRFDFGHILDFCLRLKTVIVRGGRSKIGSSNLMYHSLLFDMTSFKSADCLYFYNVQLSSIYDFGPLRQTVNTLVINNCGVKKLTDALLCDRVHKTTEDAEDSWKNLTKIDFSWNELRRIDEGIRLAPNVTSLTFDGNQIRTIENTELLPNLTSLSISANNICVEECLYPKLKNIVHLNLSQNKMEKLSPFARLDSLKELDLGSNLISEPDEIKYVSHLPALEYLVLTGNRVSTIIDYRVKVFEYFGDRASELCLDNERASQKELDRAAILRALSVVREGKTPIISPIA